MSQQEPAFYNLEFFGDAPFWNGAGDAARRTFLMPLPNPAEFLAFGVVGPSSTVHFVARGRALEHLGEFTARMAQAGATVELYARPPLPWPLVKRYTSDEPYESGETDGPKPPPINGLMGYGGGATEEYSLTRSITTENVGWPSETTRKVVVMKPNDNEFFAFGVCSSPGPLFVFAARGNMADLGSFADRMTLARASVEYPEQPSESYLRDYLEYLRRDFSITLSQVTPLVRVTESAFSDNQAAASAF
ncbi:hypothetical protein [Myxococcus sp. RHSTA-1-4]|uniref:hypothetical protein n=1 Tax=Myxococcus sp. RHSTA-1-4 TaxID=2874601 RepID=UPI001CC057E6|nr:hypothetical protein [Myxococcus sp. RHSTA-1-4]MBZ4414972.1 hypothetical protein [Myxococcus sp. RHSTA-1-4]